MVLCLPHLDVDVLQLDYFTSSSRSAMRAVFSSWTLDESHLLLVCCCAWRLPVFVTAWRLPNSYQSPVSAPCYCALQLDYFTSSSRSALRAVFSSWTLDECHAWLSRDVGLQMVLEEETRKWFPASNSGREVSEGGEGGKGGGGRGCERGM